MPDLAVRIWLPSLDRLANRNDDSSTGRSVTILRHLALLARESGRRTEALAYKRRAEDLLASHGEIAAYVAGLSGSKRCFYEHIDEDNPNCTETRPTERIVAAGILNQRAISETTPKYPDDARKKHIAGEVKVRVIVGLDGRVAEAEAISGPQELWEAARTASLAAKFNPMILEGKPTKVSGVLIYTFKP